MNVFYHPSPETNHILSEVESKHCIKVLRHQQGDIIGIVDGKGKLYEATINTAHAKNCSFSINRVIKEQKARDFSIHLAVAPTKNADRTEWMVEKAIEFGIEKITFLKTFHSERKKIRIDRIERIALSALKQSQNLFLPQISDIIPFQTFIEGVTEEEKLMAYVDDQNFRYIKQDIRKNRHYCILIGPEGDFTEEELNIALGQQFTKISLGPARLRTETAALAGVMQLNELHYA